MVENPKVIHSTHGKDATNDDVDQKSKQAVFGQYTLFFVSRV